MCWSKKLAHDDNIDYIQLAFERYKGESVLRFKVRQYISKPYAHLKTITSNI